MSLPAALSELTEAERLAVWAFRRWVAGHACGDGRHWTLVLRELGRVCGGPGGRDCVAALAAFVRALCRHAGQAIAYHEPCCPCLGADEYRVVAFLAACQRRDWECAVALAETLVVAEGIGDTLAAGACLAQILERWGQVLPRRGAPAAGRSGLGREADPASPTLH